MGVLEKISAKDAQEVVAKINGRSMASKKAARSLKRARHRALCATSSCAVSRVSFELPAFPVPLSACFNNFGRRRIESKRYTAWKRGTDEYVSLFWGKVVGNPERPTVPGAVRVRFIVKRHTNRRQDLDNLLKALCDSLTRLCVIEDDSMIVDLGIAWTSSNTFDGAVLVEIESLNGCRKIETEAAA